MRLFLSIFKNFDTIFCHRVCKFISFSKEKNPGEIIGGPHSSEVSESMPKYLDPSRKQANAFNRRLSLRCFIFY